MGSYYSDLVVGILLRFALVGAIAFLALSLAACSIRGEGSVPKIWEPAVKAPISEPGSPAGIGNQTPHGGSDEKTNSAPSKSAIRF
jgi:hypothetical protein